MQINKHIEYSYIRDFQSNDTIVNSLSILNKFIIKLWQNKKNKNFKLEQGKLKTKSSLSNGKIKNSRKSIEKLSYFWLRTDILM